jgi:hypothetical protein
MAADRLGGSDILANSGNLSRAGSTLVPSPAPKGRSAMAPSPDLRALATAIRDQGKRSHPDGFVQAAFSDNGDTLTVFWHGDVPTGIAALAANSANPTQVHFTQVPYTLAQLRAESKRISLEYPYVASAGPRSDYTGIEVKINQAKKSASAAEIESSMPVDITSGGGGWVPLVRYNDAAPFSGGTWISNPDSGFDCSTGFAMTTTTGSQAISTARHCSTAGAPNWMNPGHNRIYGTELRSNAQIDSMLLSGQSYKGWVYVGNWDSPYGVPVHGWSDPFVGDFTCDDGGLSGEVCGAKVTATDTFADGTGPGYITDVTGTHDFGSSGGGDSGGPNYIADANGGVIAAGQITSGLIESEVDACSPGAVPAAGRTCYLVVFHSNIEAIDDALLAHPMTG